MIALISSPGMLAGYRLTNANVAHNGDRVCLFRSPPLCTAADAVLIYLILAIPRFTNLVLLTRYYQHLHLIRFLHYYALTPHKHYTTSIITRQHHYHNTTRITHTIVG
jgi:hypothetical protein